jgi:sporulation protein YunB
MKRMYLKRKKKHNILNILSIFFILLLISIIYLLNLFNKKALPQFINYSEIETKKIVSSVINSTVIEETYKNTSLDNLFITTKSINSDIYNIDFNPTYVNQILVDTYSAVESNLKYLELGEVEKLNLSNLNLSHYNNNKLKKGIIYELPSGIIFNNVILNNIFPKIPVKMDLVGNIFCRLDTSVKSYGINNALITVNIVVEVEVKILLPFVSQNTKITESIPILMKIIEGNVPSYYFDGSFSNPYISKKVE